MNGTWTGQLGLSCNYVYTPGEPPTRHNPPTHPEVVIEEIYRDGVEVDEFLDVLESNGINVYERLQETILDSML